MELDRASWIDAALMRYVNIRINYFGNNAIPAASETSPTFRYARSCETSCEANAPLFAIPSFEENTHMVAENLIDSPLSLSFPPCRREALSGPAAARSTTKYFIQQLDRFPHTHRRRSFFLGPSNFLVVT